MAAITQRLRRLRPVQVHHPYPLRHFSSSSDTRPPSETESEPESHSPPTSQPSFSSYFTDVKASLQNDPPPQNPSQTLRKPPSLSTPPPPQTSPPSRFAYLDEIRLNLSEFRSRSAPAPPRSGTTPSYSTPGASSSPSVSLQELYNRHASPNNEESSAGGGLKPPIGPSFGPIRESLRHLRSSARNQSDFQSKTIDQLSLARFKESLKMKPGEKSDQGSPVIGGGDGLHPLFDKEMDKSGDDNAGSTPAMRTQFVKMYDYSELGAKLQMLRPEKKKGNWFSLHELNERLASLRLIEEKGSKTEIGGVSFSDLRETLRKLSKDEQLNPKKRNTQKVDILGQIGGTPSFMLSPPKDHLVEKYFHPDNMSSAEKLKLELKKVRDEFKMTESDCGSARVQVAQLSTKIKHLSTVLKKKDKHSRRGLEAMLDRRRKLLKYLRRTDWDSYCLVLSKFGIRDNNPDIKPAHKNKA